MTDKEINDVLLEAVSKFGKLIGLPSVKLTAKQLKTCSARKDFNSKAKDPFFDAKNALISSGKVLEDEKEKGLLTGIVYAGAANLNPAVVSVKVEGARVYIQAYAKEGLIKQKTAEKAVKTVIRELENSEKDNL